MRVTAKVDYAVRAGVELARAADGGDATPLKGERIARAQDIPVNFLENILSEMRQAGIVRSQRGAEGGYWLARDPATVSIAEVIRAVEGPLATVRGERAENVSYEADTGSLQDLWVAVRASLRGVLDHVTLADLVSGELPPSVRALVDEPSAWQ